MTRPLCIDLYCGLGGWTEGFLAEGWDVVGFDIERHDYGTGGYPGQLVLQDALTLHGSQFRSADCIVASPPCQEFSYMAMPWSRAKQIAAALREQVDFPKGYQGSRNVTDLTALFDACFRIQREACEAAGRHIPMVVENVKGAQPWVGPARANFGSFYFWGDVASVGGRIVAGTPQFGQTVKAASRNRKGWGGTWFHNAETGIGNPNRDRTATPPENGQKVEGFNFHQHEKTGTGGSFQSAAVLASEGTKQRGSGAAWFDTGIAALPSGSKTRGHVNKRDGHDHTRHLTNQRESDGAKGAATRKAASAQIAKIPFPVSSYIARQFKPPLARHGFVERPPGNQRHPNSEKRCSRPVCRCFLDPLVN